MYDRIIQAALTTPWAITPEAGAIVSEILLRRAMGARLSAEEIQARIQAAPTRPEPVKPSGNIAVIPIHGVVAHRTFEASSGMMSTEEVSAMLRRAVANPDIGTILFDVSSPGGTVTGVPELAAEIFAARKSKYLVALSNGEMGSAAYWLGSQAHEIVSIPSGSAGSIGVWMLHVDQSGALEKEGLKLTPITAGKYKTEMAPWAPLSEEAKAHLQASCDRCYEEFLAAVARGRGVRSSAVRNGYGEGRVLDAEAALEAGLIDGIETPDRTIARLAAGKRLKAGAARAEDLEAPAPRAEELPAAAAAPVDDLSDIDAALRLAERQR